MKKVFLAAVIAAWTGQVLAWSGNDILKQAQARERLMADRPVAGDTWADAALWTGFILGVAFTLDDIDPRVCLPKKSNVGQYGAVVKQYLEQNPAQLHREGHVLAREALQQAFPCR